MNDTAGVPEITTDVLVAANEEGGESNISTGWHAIEFLLWGQDLSADGAGHVPSPTTPPRPSPSAAPTYLSLLTQLLVDDLTFVRDQWDAEDGAYREEFLADPSQAVANIFRSMGALSQGELAGERIAVAYDTKDQEDEHSCFSDNTTVDIVGNAIGIRMIYTGEYDGRATARRCPRRSPRSIPRPTPPSSSSSTPTSPWRRRSKRRSTS